MLFTGFQKIFVNGGTTLVSAIASLLSGALITLCGFNNEITFQTTETLRNLAIVTFGVLPAIMITAVIVMKFYSLSYGKLKEYRKESGLHV